MKKPFSFALLFFAASCVTVNIYFPAPAVQKAADRIVEETWGEQTPKPAEPRKEPPPSGKRQGESNGLSFLIGPAHAQEADINVSTPAIRALKESIKKRSEALKQYMDKGNVGLAANGLLAMRTAEGLSLRERAQIGQLVEAENKEREALYLEIAKANNFPEERVEDIMRIFARSWIDQARSGWWIQDTGGKWKRK